MKLKRQCPQCPFPYAYGCFLDTLAELSKNERPGWLAKLKTFTIFSFTESLQTSVPGHKVTLF